LHDARIAKPSPLDIAQPAAEAGRNGQQQNGLRELHCPFCTEHAHQHQQAIARQESGRQQTVFKKQNHKQDKIEHANHGRIGQRFEILSP
jgi:hypothetical protein